MNNKSLFKILDAKYTELPLCNFYEFKKFTCLKSIEYKKTENTANIKRASNVSKAAINHLVACERKNDYDYMIFITRYGELPFVEKNNQDNSSKQELSPTSFSHSVHNTATCLYSIIINSKVPSTSLATNGKMIKTAIYEAISYLNCNENSKKVLITIYDSHIPDRYQEMAKENPINFVLSFIVSKTDTGILGLEKIVNTLNKLESFSEELFVLNDFCCESQNQYREIQQFYESKHNYGSEYLTEYYV